MTERALRTPNKKAAHGGLTDSMDGGLLSVYGCLDIGRFAGPTWRFHYIRMHRIADQMADCRIYAGLLAKETTIGRTPRVRL